MSYQDSLLLTLIHEKDEIRGRVKALRRSVRDWIDAVRRLRDTETSSHGPEYYDGQIAALELVAKKLGDESHDHGPIRGHE